MRCSMVNNYEWLNKEKSRFYRISIENNEYVGIMLKFRWGGCNSNRGGKKNVCMSSEEEVRVFMAKMMKRRKSRGYELIAPVMN